MAGRQSKRWLLWLAAPSLAVALLVAFWSWDWFIPLAEAKASAAVGRPVHIEHLHVKLGRVSTVSVEGLRIGNPWLSGQPAFCGGRPGHGAAGRRRLPAFA